MLVSVAKKKTMHFLREFDPFGQFGASRSVFEFFLGFGGRSDQAKIQCSPLPSGLWVFARKPTNRSEGVNIVKNQSVFAHSASKPHKPLGRGENLNFDFLLGAHGAPGGAERYPQAFSKCNFHPSRAVCGFLDTIGTRY